MTAATNASIAPGVDMKLEVVVIPVSDVDRAKRFYAGWAGGWMRFASGETARDSVHPPGSPSFRPSSAGT